MMTPEEHQQEHIRLHRELDMLLACYLAENRWPVLHTSIHDDLFEFLRWSHEKTLAPSPQPEHVPPPTVLTAQNDDPELLEWLSNAKEHAGGFLHHLAEAGLRADYVNYSVIRYVLMAMRAKYPAYEPTDAVKQEIRERKP